MSSLGFRSAVLLALVVIVAVVVFQKPASIRLEKPSEASTYEIYAKQSYWDKISDPVVILTFFLTISTIFLWVATADLADVAYAQSADIKRSITAAEDSAIAARQSADALIVIESAFVREVISPVDITRAFVLSWYDKSPNMGPVKCDLGIDLRFKNYGKTPADIIVYGWQIEIATRQRIIGKDAAILPRQYTLSESTIPSGGISEDVGNIEKHEISWSDSNELARAQKYIWVNGWVQYKTIFGKTEVRYFAWRYDRRRNAFAPCDPYAK